jgi:hypothetical protein
MSQVCRVHMLMPCFFNVCSDITTTDPFVVSLLNGIFLVGFLAEMLPATCYLLTYLTQVAPIFIFLELKLRGL